MEGRVLNFEDSTTTPANLFSQNTPVGESFAPQSPPQQQQQTARHGSLFDGPTSNNSAPAPVGSNGADSNSHDDESFPLNGTPANQMLPIPQSQPHQQLSFSSVPRFHNVPEDFVVQRGGGGGGGGLTPLENSNSVPKRLALAGCGDGTASSFGGGGGGAPGEDTLIMIPQTPTKQRRTIHGKGDATRMSSSTQRPYYGTYRIPSSQPNKGSNHGRAYRGGGSGGEGHINMVSATANAVPIKYMRSEYGGRKRSADTISQFNAMDINESVRSLTPQSTTPATVTATTTNNINSNFVSMAHLIGNYSSQPSQQRPRLNAGNNSFNPNGAGLWQCDPCLTPTTLSQQATFERNMSSQVLVRPSQDALELSQADTEYSVFLAKRILTDYRELKQLGRGSFGKVCLYEEISSGELVAVKISLPVSSSDEEHRYRREKCVMGLMRGAPHIVQLSAAWEEGRPPQMYLQLEYCPGGSVAALAEQKRARDERWDEKDIMVFFLHMAIALDALHRNNIAHVDFKPDNILIDANGAYKLSDFGCSVLLDEAGRPKRSMRAYGTPRGNAHVRPVLAAANGNHNGTTSTFVNPSLTVRTVCAPSGSNFMSPARRGTAAAAAPGGGGGGTFDFNLCQEGTQHSMVSVDEGDCRYLCADMLNEKTDFKAGDMFSLGMSLYELLSGKPLPKNGDEFLALRSGLPVDVLVQQRGYSQRLVDLVVRLVTADPAARPTAREVLVCLRPPPNMLQLLGSEETIRQWTGSTESFQGLVQSGNASLSHLQYLSAMMEASSWLLETTQQSVLAALSGALVAQAAAADGNTPGAADVSALSVRNAAPAMITQDYGAAASAVVQAFNLGSNTHGNISTAMQEAGAAAGAMGISRRQMQNQRDEACTPMMEVQRGGVWS